MCVLSIGARTTFRRERAKCTRYWVPGSGCFVRPGRPWFCPGSVLVLSWFCPAWSQFVPSVDAGSGGSAAYLAVSCPATFQTGNARESRFGRNNLLVANDLRRPRVDFVGRIVRTVVWGASAVSKQRPRGGRTQCAVVGTWYCVLGTRHWVLGTEYWVLNGAIPDSLIPKDRPHSRSIDMYLYLCTNDKAKRGTGFSAVFARLHRNCCPDNALQLFRRRILVPRKAVRLFSQRTTAATSHGRRPRCSARGPRRPSAAKPASARVALPEGHAAGAGPGPTPPRYAHFAPRWDAISSRRPRFISWHRPARHTTTGSGEGHDGHHALCHAKCMVPV